MQLEVVDLIFNGQHLKNARKAANLTQNQLGELVGITGVAIMRYENNQRRPSNEIFEKLANALNVPPVTLAIGMTQEEWDALDPRIGEALEASTQTFDSFERGELVETPIEVVLDTEDRERKKHLDDAYSKLNDEGQLEAVRRLEEMTEVPKYQRNQEHK